MMIMMMMFSRGKGGGGNFRSADSCVQEWAVPVIIESVPLP
jgi:hypothetical protein